MTVNRRPFSAACFGVVLYGLAACAAHSSRRVQDADAHFRMATAALQQAGGIQNEVNRRAAYPELTQAIKLDPGFAEGHNSLGLIYLSQGKIAEAAAEFQKALENLSYPTPEYAAYNLGKASYQLKDFAVAAESYERSLAILPNNPDARFELGMSYAQLGRLADAEKAFTAALQMRPDVARTRYELGMVLFKLGRRSEAVVHFRRVVELDPAGDLGEQSRTYLKLLK